MKIGCMIVLLCLCITLHAETPANALRKAMEGTQGSAVVLDMANGHVLAQEGLPRRATPGSAVKPFVMEYALEHGYARPETQVYCRRDLKINGRSLACTHPAGMPVMDAESALAESCNTWFAALARRMPGDAVENVFAGSGLPHQEMRSTDADQRALAVLGLWGSTASPIELAKAYRGLALRLHEGDVVWRGMRGSVEHGMANPATTKGLLVLGKTGTATNPGESWTHGWFAGVLPGRLVLVVYVPKGDGGTAARLAHAFFVEMQR